MKRVFIIVLDSLGIGAEPDAADFGDVGANTLRSVSAGQGFAIPHLLEAGMGNLDGVDYLPRTDKPTAALARLTFTADGAVAAGKPRFFRRVHAGNADVRAAVVERERVVLAEGFAQLGEQVVAAGAGQIRNGDIRWIDASAGSSAGDDGDSPLAALGDEVAFRPHGVDGVDDNIRPGVEEALRVGNRVEGGDGDDFCLRVDESDALGHDVDFDAADAVVEGVYLAVGVGDAEVVEVEHDDSADTAAGQGFCCPGADTANADDSGPGLSEKLGSVFAVEAFNADEAFGFHHFSQMWLMVVMPVALPVVSSMLSRAPLSRAGQPATGNLRGMQVTKLCRTRSVSRPMMP